MYIKMTQIRKMIFNKVSPIYLDEIGILELHDQCFNKILKQLIDSNLDVYVVIREELIKPIIEKYLIKEYKIITWGE